MWIAMTLFVIVRCAIAALEAALVYPKPLEVSKPNLGVAYRHFGADSGDEIGGERGAQGTLRVWERGRRCGC
jgi:hypothetical protein